MYRRSTTTSLETNPFSQRIFLHSSLLQFCISFDRLCGRSSSCIGSIMSKFSPAVVFFNRTPFSSFCCEFPSYSWRLISEPSMKSFILFESRYFSAFNCHAIKNKIIPHVKCLQRKIREGFTVYQKCTRNVDRTQSREYSYIFAPKLSYEPFQIFFLKALVKD